MYAERNSRLLQGPASDRIHRLSRQCRTELRSHVQKGQSVVTGSNSHNESTSHGITLSRHDVLESVAYEEGFPVISRLSAGITPSSGNSITRQGISLP